MQENDELGLKHLKRRGPVTAKYRGRNGMDAPLLHPLGDVRQMVGQRVVYIGRGIPDEEGDTEELEERRGGEETAHDREFWAPEHLAERFEGGNVASTLPEGVQTHQ